METVNFLFVLVISTNPVIDEWEYQGNFESCDIAYLWMTLHRPDVVASKCMLREYIYLPKDTKIRSIDMKNNTIRYYDSHSPCKLKRNCNG